MDSNVGKKVRSLLKYMPFIDYLINTSNNDTLIEHYMLIKEWLVTRKMLRIEDWQRIEDKFYLHYRNLLTENVIIPKYVTEIFKTIDLTASGYMDLCSDNSEDDDIQFVSYTQPNKNAASNVNAGPKESVVDNAMNTEKESPAQSSTNESAPEFKYSSLTELENIIRNLCDNNNLNIDILRKLLSSKINDARPLSFQQSAPILQYESEALSILRKFNLNDPRIIKQLKTMLDPKFSAVATENAIVQSDLTASLPPPASNFSNSFREYEIEPRIPPQESAAMVAASVSEQQQPQTYMGPNREMPCLQPIDKNLRVGSQFTSEPRTYYEYKLQKAAAMEHIREGSQPLTEETQSDKSEMTIVESQVIELPVKTNFTANLKTYYNRRKQHAKRTENLVKVGEGQQDSADETILHLAEPNTYRTESQPVSKPRSSYDYNVQQITEVIDREENIEQTQPQVEKTRTDKNEMIILTPQNNANTATTKPTAEHEKENAKGPTVEKRKVQKQQLPSHKTNKSKAKEVQLSYSKHDPLKAKKCMKPNATNAKKKQNLEGRREETTKVDNEQKKLDSSKPKTADLTDPAVNQKQLKIILHRTKRPQRNKPNIQSVKETEKVNPSNKTEMIKRIEHEIRQEPSSSNKNKKKPQYNKKIIDYQETVDVLISTLSPHENELKKVLVKRGNEYCIKDCKDIESQAESTKSSKKEEERVQKLVEASRKKSVKKTSWHKGSRTRLRKTRVNVIEDTPPHSLSDTNDIDSSDTDGINSSDTDSIHLSDIDDINSTDTENIISSETDHINSSEIDSIDFVRAVDKNPITKCKRVVVKLPRLSAIEILQHTTNPNCCQNPVLVVKTFKTVPVEPIPARLTLPKVPNTDLNMILQNTKYCVLCKSKPVDLTNHYVQMHKTESYVARLSAEMLEDLQENIPFAEPFKGSLRSLCAQKYCVKCVFCDLELFDYFTNFHQHYSSHTGEFGFECSYCHFKKPFRADIQRHLQYTKIRECRRSITRILYQYNENLTVIYAHCCKICNFIQLNEANVFKHMRDHHGKRQDDPALVRKFILAAICDQDIYNSDSISNSVKNQKILDNNNENMDKDLLSDNNETMLNHHTHNEPVDANSSKSKSSASNEADGKSTNECRMLGRVFSSDGNDTVLKKKHHTHDGSVDANCSKLTSSANNETDGKSTNECEILKNNDLSTTRTSVEALLTQPSQTLSDKNVSNQLPSVNNAMQRTDESKNVKKNLVLPMTILGSDFSEYLHTVQNVAPNSTETIVKNINGYNNKSNESAFKPYITILEDISIIDHDNQKKLIKNPHVGGKPLDMINFDKNSSELTSFASNEIDEKGSKGRANLKQEDSLVVPTTALSAILTQSSKTIDDLDQNAFNQLSSSSNSTNKKRADGCIISNQNSSVVPMTLASGFSERTVHDHALTETEATVRNINKENNIPTFAPQKSYKKYPTYTSSYGLFKCMAPDCYYSTNSKDKMITHLLQHMDSTCPPNDFMNCSYCEAKFCNEAQSAHDLVEHVWLKHGHSLYQCSQCCYRSCLAGNVLIHSKMQHERTKENDCFIYRCEGRPSSSDELISYMEKCQLKNVKLPKCSYCCCEYDSLLSLFNHTKSVHNQLLMSFHKFACIYCEHEELKEQAMQEHLAQMHPDEYAFTFQRGFRTGLSFGAACDQIVSVDVPILPKYILEGRCNSHEDLESRDSRESNEVSDSTVNVLSQTIESKPTSDELIRIAVETILPILLKLTRETGISPNRLYSCGQPTCDGSIFSKYSLWLHHMIYRHRCVIARCPHCVSVTVEMPVEDYLEHFEKHRRHLFICYHCDSTFQSADLLTMHGKTAHIDISNLRQETVASNSTQEYKILVATEFCDDRLQFLQNLLPLFKKRLQQRADLKSQTILKKWKVPYNNNWIDKFPIYRKHLQKCFVNVCRFHSDNSSDLFVHMRTHKTQILKYKCYTCEFTIDHNPTWESIFEHTETHTGNLYICCTCGLYHYDLQIVKTHIENNHASRDTGLVLIYRSTSGCEIGLSIILAKNELTFTTLKTCFCCTSELGIYTMTMHLKKAHGLDLHYFCEICNDEIINLQKTEHHFQSKHPGMTLKLRCDFYSQNQVYIETLKPLCVKVDFESSSGKRKMEDTELEESNKRKKLLFDGMIIKTEDDEISDDDVIFLDHDDVPLTRNIKATNSGKIGCVPLTKLI